jgi:hypothetical protein
MLEFNFQLSKELTKVEGGILQMASTMSSINNSKEFIQGQVITWRSLALVLII